MRKNTLLPVVLCMAAGLAHASPELLRSAEQGDLAGVQHHLRSGAAVDTRDARQRTPLLLATWANHPAVAQALIEQMYISGNTRPAALYWGGRRPEDLYMHDWVLDKVAHMPNLRYVPVVSNALPEDNWTGRTGFVHQAVLDDTSDLSGHQVYACGAPIVVDTARTQYTAQAGLPEDQFFADAFTSEADKHGA